MEQEMSVLQTPCAVTRNERGAKAISFAVARNECAAKARNGACAANARAREEGSPTDAIA